MRRRKNLPKNSCGDLSEAGAGLTPAQLATPVEPKSSSLMNKDAFLDKLDVRLT
jgi:hypothetical protein